MTGKNININVIIGAILSLMFIYFSLSGGSFLEKLEVNLYDIGSGLVHDDNFNPDKIVLIEIDDKSLDKLGSWPWPRRILAEMIDALKENGVQLIGMNIPFDGIENNEGLEELRKFREKFKAYPAGSGDTALKKWALDNLDQIEKKINGDSTLLTSVKNAGNVFLPVYFANQLDNDNKTTDDSFLLKNALNASTLSSSLKENISINRMLCPTPELGSNAAGLGLINTTTTISDRYGRSYPAYISYKGILFPSLPLRMAASYYGLGPEALIVKDNMIVLKNRSIPLSKGKMFIKFRGVKKQYSFSDILDNKSLKADLKGKIVFIGLNDFKNKRFNLPGVVTETQLNAQLLDNIINSGTISRPFFLPYLETILILLIGISAAFIFSDKGRISHPVIVLGLFLIILSVGFVMFIGAGIWIKTFYLAGCLVSVYLVLVLKELFISEVFRKASPEEIRLLGIGYQNKGLLDQAFKKFQRLPPDNESKELIYKLGLEYENKSQIDKALEVYDYILSIGGYQDIEARIAGLRGADKASIMGKIGEIDKSVNTSDSGGKTRSKVGRYEILSVLGKGSMGLVYKALDPKINRTVAIKTIRFSDEFDEDVIQEIKERFFREAEIAGQLSHPSIVTIYDVGEDGDLTYMAMEFLEGDDLDNFITKRNLLSFRRVLDVVLNIAEALDYAHKANVIHRDIKPANVMLLKNGNVKVTDFGIAKAISSSRTKTGVILGTPNYMSPEQIMGQKIDFKSDIFSLGVLFYQLITGELPFHGDNLSGLLYQITQIKHPSPRSYNPKVPNICEQILDKALAKDPSKRFKSAGELARVINSLGQRIDQMRSEKSSGK
jgi:eukaryotic-like serine/threonine-protein kinase